MLYVTNPFSLRSPVHPFDITGHRSSLFPPLVPGLCIHIHGNRCGVHTAIMYDSKGVTPGCPLHMVCQRNCFKVPRTLFVCSLAIAVTTEGPRSSMRRHSIGQPNAILLPVQVSPRLASRVSMTSRYPGGTQVWRTWPVTIFPPSLPPPRGHGE